MPDDLTDDVNSISLSSSERSGSETIASVSTSSSNQRHHKNNTKTSSSNNMQLSNLKFLKKLGSGDIGSVYLSELKCDEAEQGCMLLAAKVMDKKELEGRNKEGRARTEKEILEVLDHPFLPKLYGCVENERWSCLLTEFCPGGDLHALRQRQCGKRFVEAAVRFYASEVVVALEYIHMMGIVYRDLKPENVLVRSDGHIMLTDFDLSLKSNDQISPSPQLISNQTPNYIPKNSTNPSQFSNASCILPSCIIPTVSCFTPKHKYSTKRVKNRRRGPTLEFVAEPVDLRSMSFVGTHEYLAPEIVSGEGHGSTVDWWTLGVFMYELIYGVTPFKGADNELTLANIVARALEFPKDDFPVSSSLKDLITGLLVKDPVKRMGSTMGAAAIKKHPYFHGVNWALLRCASPPYIPPELSVGNSSVDVSDDSGPGTPVEYY